MIKPDIIISWPRNCDYPLWRQFIHDNRSRFNEIIIVFTDTFENDDYSQFVRETMFRDAVIFVDNPRIQAGQDWRDVAIHQALLHSYNAEWVWFTEQDFFVADGFFEEMDRLAQEGNEVVAVYDGPRMHPCSILVKRDALNKTRKNFGVVPDVSDHFSIFQRDVEGNGTRIVQVPSNLWFHMNGLSSNFSQVERGGMPNYKPKIFDEYIRASIQVRVPLHPRFREICEGYLVKIGTPFVKSEFSQAVDPLSPTAFFYRFEAKSEKSTISK